MDGSATHLFQASSEFSNNAVTCQQSFIARVRQIHDVTFEIFHRFVLVAFCHMTKMTFDEITFSAAGVCFLFLVLS